ncbi:MAG: alpha/beta fold hydrolase [Candidatus Hodarchaeota archaeon]
MTKILTKNITTDFGDLTYYRTRNENQDFEVLFIHGLGENKDWFPHQYESYSLKKFSWIVPDLIGYGESAKPKSKKAYQMDEQARNLVQLLVQEKIKKQSLVIIAHSLGGPIAISLIEQLSLLNDPEIKPLGLIYLEGNLDKNDAFFSSQIAKYSFDDYEQEFEGMLKDILEKPEDYPEGYYEKARNTGSFPLWATSVDVVLVSESNELLPRLQKHLDFPAYFVFGEKNKNRFPSETLIKNNELPLIYIPNCGHFMHLENPETFWKIITKLILSL